MPQFDIGRQYAPRELRQTLGLPEGAGGGGWFRGYQKHQGAFYVFATVRSHGGRKDSERRDHWEGALLFWSAKGEARASDPEIRELVAGGRPVHVFWRHEDAPAFAYAGQGTPREIRDTQPASVLWECHGGRPSRFGD